MSNTAISSSATVEVTETGKVYIRSNRLPRDLRLSEREGRNMTFFLMDELLTEDFVKGHVDRVGGNVNNVVFIANAYYGNADPMFSEICDSLDTAKELIVDKVRGLTGNTESVHVRWYNDETDCGDSMYGETSSEWNYVIYKRKINR